MIKKQQISSAAMDFEISHYGASISLSFSAGAKWALEQPAMEENNFKAQQMNKIQPETIIALVKNVGRDISTEEAIRLLEAMETMVEIAGTAPVITKQVLDHVENERVMNARRNETDDTLLRMQLLQLHYVVQDLIAGWIVS